VMALTGSMSVAGERPEFTVLKEKIVLRVFGATTGATGVDRGPARGSQGTGSTLGTWRASATQRLVQPSAGLAFEHSLVCLTCLRSVTGFSELSKSLVEQRSHTGVVFARPSQPAPQRCVLGFEVSHGGATHSLARRYLPRRDR
jgi:hypothetical protein